jgi:predicted PurR-regulated permease PerM
MTNSEDPRSFLSPMQRRLVSVALVVLALNMIGAFLFGVFLLLRRLVLYFSDILWPLAAAGILALLLKPLVHRLQKTLRIGRIGSIVLLYGLGVIACLLVVALVLPVLFTQAGAFINYFPSLLEELVALITPVFPDAAQWARDTLNADALREHLHALLDNYREILGASMPALTTLGEFLTSTFTMAAGLVIVPVYLFFFLLSDTNPLRAVDKELSFIPAGVREDAVFLAGEFARIMVAFFRGQILIGLAMGVLFAVGFSLVGLRFGAFLGIIIGILNIIPYLGSILGLLVILPLSFFQQGGGVVLLLLVLGVFIIVQLVESYFLTPKIMGRTTGLHPLTIIISIFFWGKALGGILGMILAIPLTAFFVVAWRLARKKYLTPESAQAGGNEQARP